MPPSYPFFIVFLQADSRLDVSDVLAVTFIIMIPDVLQTYLHRLSHGDVSMLLPDDVEALHKNAVRWADESNLTELAAALGCYPTRDAVVDALHRLADTLSAQITDIP